jgi:hypothetical protein
LWEDLRVLAQNHNGQVERFKVRPEHQHHQLHQQRPPPSNSLLSE